MKIDEYFDNTNSSDDNEEDSLDEAGRRNEIVRQWYNDDDDDPYKNVIREELINPDTLIQSIIYSQYNKWATTTISPNKNFGKNKFKNKQTMRWLS